MNEIDTEDDTEVGRFILMIFYELALVCVFFGTILYTTWLGLVQFGYWYGFVVYPILIAVAIVFWQFASTVA